MTQDFITENEECKILRDANSKLEVELKEIREMEKSHRYHLLNSREMIGNLQETVSQLVYLKRDVKKLKEQISLKDTNIADIEKVHIESYFTKNQICRYSSSPIVLPIQRQERIALCRYENRSRNYKNKSDFW